ncbi:(deoxy)nucleoside triphosphate pyrophosphohydrolase [Aeromicrobium wangtongii]|uniref:(deoxy)nucleoside triphosphate pyrophosphohydrolase n=1 Tax=Aeromicrobium wangtongii TaxID=2969247 RepID=UPI0020175873|nr:(deoxy)nucleoside triphosphate pyrophosphohydrolase [Aeromicrobium wangtongii]MCL3818969.1 (deoxy)nucleoside triphosphate pyrophosphohydrolase [Aeromicrobium wangtongii]
MSGLPLVVGAVILDRSPEPSRVLAARRNRPPSLAGQWEFPGGKVEPGESPQDALVREIREELAVDIRLGDELLPVEGETWPASNGFQMRLFLATIVAGEAAPQDGHDAVRWLTRDQLGEVEWLDSDRDVLPELPI